MKLNSRRVTADIAGLVGMAFLIAAAFGWCVLAGLVVTGVLLIAVSWVAG